MKPRKNTYKKRILEDLYRKEEVRGEQRSTFFILFIIIPPIVVITIIIAITDRLHLNSVFNLTLAAVGTVYYTLIAVLLKMKKYRPFMKYISVTVNVLITTCVLCTYSLESGWLHSMRTVVLSTYILCIITAGLYQNPAVPIFAGILSVLCYGSLAMYGMFAVHIPLNVVETFTAPRYSLDILLWYLAVFLIMAVIVSSLNRRYREMLTRSLDSEAYSKVVKRAHAQKTRFFINLAHETKTPLTLISNYLEEYAEKHGEEREISIVRQSVDKLAQDMIAFLDYEKLTRGQVFYDHGRVVNFAKALSLQCRLFEELASRKGIDFSTDIAERVYMRIDPSALERIINNLIDNAVKYTESGGSIRVSLSVGTSVVFTVSDTGMGIPERQQKDIFKPFHQLSHMKRNVQGIGMGLAIVKRIAGEVNGKILLESVPGKGTRFTIAFPAISAEEGAGIVEEFSPAALPACRGEIELLPPRGMDGKPNLFIVEDNKAMLRYFQDTLGAEFNIDYAFDGKEALEKLRDASGPDVILSDIMMDTMDGYEFHDRLMEADRFHAVPFIYVTALSSHAEKIKALRKGAVEYLYKPFHIDELKGKLHSIIRVQQALSSQNLREMGRRLAARAAAGGADAAGEGEGASFRPLVSRRQIQIAALLKAGLERKEISHQLGISINTVNTQIKRMFEKCKVNNKVELLNILSGL